MARRTRSRATAKSLALVQKHPPTEHARNYAQVAYEFAEEAAADRYGRKHCRWVRLAAKRHLADLRRQRQKSCHYRFDEWHANDVCDFAEKMPHVEGSWNSSTITLEPAQVFILCSVFGWRRKADGTRRFTTAYIEMARKGAKSTLTAVVCHYCLSCEAELGPQVIIGATTREQADKVFLPAKKMAERTRDYREAFGVEVWANSISGGVAGGFIQPINAKASTQDGWNPYLAVLDELHAHKDRGLYDVVRSSFGARRSQLLWIITTAGYNVEGVCYEQHQFVAKVLQGIFEADHYFGVIFTLDEHDDEFDERKWIKANPLLGVTPSLATMREYATEARSSPDSHGEFKTKRLNIWTSAKNGWLNMTRWKKCAIEVPTDGPCFGGIDLASTSDITAWALVWFVEGRIRIRGKWYLPEATVRPRTERGNVPYQRWADEGHLVVTPGEVTDYDYLYRDILEELGRHPITEIGFDPWNATQLVGRLLEENAPMVEIRQGPKTMHPPMQALERALKAGLIDHGNDPVLTWAASNIVARKDVNENMAPDRKNSHEKIDPVVAALNALARAVVHQDQSSVYDGRGLLVV